MITEAAAERPATRTVESMAGRLIVVSNRLPLTLVEEGGTWHTKRSAGGLATAMNSILRRTGGLWIGWPGEAAGDDPRRKELLAGWEEKEGVVAIDLPPAIAEGFYEGFSNQAIWPLFHYFPARMRFDPAAWDAYARANRRFLDETARRARQDDLIWVHDYQLMLLPRLLREALPEARIGFFLHIPFPAADVFAALPRREEILEGLLGADLVAFHTHNYLQNFRDALLRMLGMESRMNEVETGGRTARLEALPIGIAPDEFAGPARDDPEVRRRLEELRGQFEGQRILLAVDRLDYTKGIPERLRAFRRLLETAGEWRGKVVLIQIAVPSREGIALYQDLRSEVNELVGEINGKLGTADWTPVVYINRSVERRELLALYAAADIGWVTPLRDGLNLVAKEYCACKAEGDGVLVLSEFAGAAAEMGEAFLVNPIDEERTAETIERALRLDEEERRERMRPLYERVTHNNVFVWSERFLAALREAAEARARLGELGPRPLNTVQAVAAYRAARRRILMLDYDGTLAPFVADPQRAAPPPALLDTLRTLAADPANCVALVSGRRAADLQRWFGSVPGMVLVAEHGAMWRRGDRWETAGPDQPADWKQDVRPVLDHFVDRTPGSFVEEKRLALVWHYRQAEPEFGEWLANELVAMLEKLLAQTGLRAYRGRKIVEVKPLWVNKGLVPERMAALWPDADYRFAVGDDRTDEDLFARLGEGDWTVHVGPGETRAAFTLPNVAAVRALLEAFAKTRD